MLSKLSFLFGNPVLVRRLSWAAVCVLCVLATFALSRATDRAQEIARTNAVQSAWRASASVAAVPTDPQAVYRRFGIKPATANADLTWQVNSASELRASLRALDAANVNLSQAKVSRSGAVFVITAERAP